MKNFLLGIAVAILMCGFVVYMARIDRRFDAIERSIAHSQSQQSNFSVRSECPAGHGQFQRSEVSDPFAKYGGKRIDQMTVGECDTLKDGHKVTITAIYPDGTFDAKTGCQAK